MKKIICRMLAGTFLVLFFLPISALANGPVAAPWLSFELLDLPKDVAYVDILIKISPNESKFTSINMQNLEELGFMPESDIVLYDVDGFRSFTFHYKDAVSSIDVYKDRSRSRPHNGIGYIEFCNGTEYREFYTQYEDLLTNFRTMKLAFLDDGGAVISVSEEFDLPKMSSLFVFLNYATYDYRTGSIDMDMYTNPWFMVANIFVSLSFVVHSIGIEIVTALCFGFNGWRKIALIAIVNAISQTFMRIAYLILPLPHLPTIILLETLIYSSEFLVYRKSKAMAFDRTIKILIYTIVANTLSFLVVALMNGFGLRA